jgi:hypothetical protein
MAHLHQSIAFKGAFELLRTVSRSSQTVYTVSFRRACMNGFEG